MANRKVKNFRDLIDALDKFRTRNEDWMFRGQARGEWPLIPKAGRPEFNGIDDIDLLSQWKRTAMPYVAREALSEWDWITLAQHHGLATRLLDWTVNPLAAAYFAVISDFDADGAVFCFIAEDDSYYLNELPESIQDVTELRILLPRHVSSRIVQQSGRFTIHPVPSKPVKRGTISKIIISKKAKSQIQRDLSYYGVNHAALFVDLDGRARFLNWFYQEYRR